MIAAILAGGKGTRLGEKAGGLPKPLVPLAGKSILEYQIESLRKCGIGKILLLTGYKGEVIRDRFKDGAMLGLAIDYAEEQEPLGTGGAVRRACAFLNEPFLVLYGDCMVDMDFGRMIAFHNSKKGIATLAVHPNSHPLDSDLLDVDNDDRIIGFYPKPHSPEGYRRNLVNAGVYILTPELVERIPEGFSDFGKDIFPDQIRAGQTLYGYSTSEYIKDMGTVDRLASVERDIEAGKPKSRNLMQRQRAIFLDRDGVINEEVDLIRRAEDIRLLPGVEAAIKKINGSNFLCIVVTNQPAVARGLCSLDEVRKMHNRVDTLLGREGALVDRYYFCPHHPDRGFPEENSAFKIACDCRKPAIGMVRAAEEKFNIDIAHSYIIGDSTRDIQTGKNAGLFSILVGTGYAGSDKGFEVLPDHYASDLTDAVDFILHYDPAGRR